MPLPLLPFASALTASCTRALRALPAVGRANTRPPAHGRRIMWKLWECMLGEVRK